MSGAPVDPPPQAGANPLLDEAIGWCLRMHGEEADKYQAEFEAWIGLGGVHREIYSQVCELHGFGETLRGINIDREGQSPSSDHSWLQKSTWRVPVLGLAVIIAMAVSAFTIEMAQRESVRGDVAGASRLGSRQIQTALGEIRIIRLADGTRVTLDTDSLLTFDKQGVEQRVRVERGRARFEVVQQRRPFTVLTGDRAILADGSIFDVTFPAEDAVQVLLLRGKAEVQSSYRRLGSLRRPGVQLATGFLGSFRPGDEIMVRRADRHDAAAQQWPSGLAAFKGVPLSEVVRQANRYAVTKIYISDSVIGTRLFHGTLRMNDTRALAHILAHAFALRVVEEEGVIALRPR